MRIIAKFVVNSLAVVGAIGIFQEYKSRKSAGSLNDATEHANRTAS